jgi:predicted dehydrogenase
LTGSQGKAQPQVRFAAIGLNHGHIYGQVECMRRAGAELVSFYAPEDDLAVAFAATYPTATRAATRAEILEADDIQLILTAAIPGDRAGICIAAMQHGKDAMTDKPGATSLAQLAELRRVQAETGRIYSVFYEERFENEVTTRAIDLVRSGAIGEFVHLTGFGPHLLRATTRASWFFERARYGGIITDLGSHQCDQFLCLADDLDTEVVSASVANRAHPETPQLQDLGELQLRSSRASGYFRLDWFTPRGLPVFGDCRLIIIGTEGYIEARKYIDIGHPEAERFLYLVDNDGVRHIDCAEVDLPYGRQLFADIVNRTETAMTQAHCFKATELALQAQALAEGQTVGR